MNKIAKERIKELKRQQKYNEIFIEFGQKAYKKNIPSKYKKEELKKLKKEGRYEDIFSKYGKKEYETILIRAMYNEIKENKGKFKAALWRIGQELKLLGGKTALMLSVGSVAFTGAISEYSESIKEENSIKYESEINEYNQKISNYAKEVNKMKLTDVQIFMKVMDDMWGSIQGYKSPDKNIMYFWELDLATEEGYGVCKNMASDVSKKLNAINPKYNARTMNVTVGNDGVYKFADIDVNIIDDNETVKNDKEQRDDNEKDSSLDDTIVKLFGNHMVTLVDIESDNLTIVLDPTNPGIGIYKDGKITMFNSGKEKGISFDAREYSTAIATQGGMDGIINVASGYAKSFKEPTLTLEELENKYGLQAQNRALAEVRKMKTVDDKKKTFNESLKVDVSQLNQTEQNNETSTITIENNDIEKY